MNISDSVVMGDVQQNITNVQQHISSSNTCPRCEAINVRVVSCSMPHCDNQFCELCHPLCRWTPEGVGRLDSGLGKGPFCGLCMEVQVEQWENEELEEQKLREMSLASDRAMPNREDPFAPTVEGGQKAMPECQLILQWSF